jgi:ribosomal protein S27E
VHIVKRKYTKGVYEVHQEYYTAFMPKRCPLCGSDKLILDIERGQLVCTSCGYVVDDIVFDYTLRTDSPRAGFDTRRASVELRYERTMLAVTASRARLVKRLGTEAAKIIDGLRSDPLAAKEALRLLSNPCIKRVLKDSRDTLVAAVLKSLIYYMRNGEYPLYAEAALEHELEAKDRTRFKKMLRRALRCLDADTPTAVLATPA